LGHAVHFESITSANSITAAHKYNY